MRTLSYFQPLVVPRGFGMGVRSIQGIVFLPFGAIRKHNGRAYDFGSIQTYFS